MSFPNSNFEGNFSTYGYVSHFVIIESWKYNVGHRDIYYGKKIFNSFVSVELWILVKKWNVY